MAAMYKGVDPNAVAQEIMSIGESATPRQIVDKARDESTELHKCFEWDDAKAALGYRLQQARTLVHVLVIEDEQLKPDTPPVRFFYKVENDAGYKPTQFIIKKEDEYQQLLQRAYAELHAFKMKYARLTELQDILDLIA